MNLDQALEIMSQYAQDRGQDDLSALEHMARNLRSLTAEQLEAVDRFIAESRKIGD